MSAAVSNHEGVVLLGHNGQDYRNRNGDRVQVMHAIKCGWFEVVLDNQQSYYVDPHGRHRHNRKLDLVCEYGAVPPQSPKKKRRKLIGKYLVDVGDDVDTTQPITKQIGKWIRYGKDWKYSELDVTVVED